MPSQKDLFEVSGPTYLTYVNWNCPHHRRSVMASLVHGVYVLERDRQLNRQGPDARAPAWWRSFHFELQHALVDAADNSVFGAVYAFHPPPAHLLLHDPAAAATASRPQHRPDRVWLAGHSLGSAIAFLFNAPFVSAPMERIGDERVRQGIRVAASFVTAGVAAVLKKGNAEEEEAFAALARWVPHVFVNPADPISAEYVGYFDHRRRMERIGAGGVGRLATRSSVKDLLLGKEPLHLFPSAVLTVNRGPAPDFKAAHGIHQWWRHDLLLDCTEHYYYS
ncbi:hypothetical protein PR202_gb04957 [Eleusine coracana subsp. coracana]|uniref:Fungal lipase-type domain-containing protein n=1 Tax=Eleusine coracana subsp. coracana TaxID=191504 RepID=A0AAV5E5U0_ELECO|nr:hypothetical protein QOZ80_1BG0081330 [Eleusine coracana subsp. coracana]GJN17854.1 hypothetical protein PR202_gb04957 [Eleusine coracana subsp. coracana]